MPADQFVLKNSGAIQELTVDIPAHGGVMLIGGGNGRGKSTALSAVRALAGGRVEFSKRDGSDVATISGPGATLTLRRSASRGGDCGRPLWFLA